jgi:hypothetical protein
MDAIPLASHAYPFPRVWFARGLTRQRGPSQDRGAPHLENISFLTVCVCLRGSIQTWCWVVVIGEDTPSWIPGLLSYAGLEASGTSPGLPSSRSDSWSERHLYMRAPAAASMTHTALYHRRATARSLRSSHTGDWLPDKTLRSGGPWRRHDAQLQLLCECTPHTFLLRCISNSCILCLRHRQGSWSRGKGNNDARAAVTTLYRSRMQS